MAETYDQKTLYQRMIMRQDDMELKRAYLEYDNDRIIDLFRPDIVKFRDKIGSYSAGYNSGNYSNSGSYSYDASKGILGANIFEGTGPWASRLMADGMQGNLVSPSIDWIRYAMDDPIFKGNDEVNKWLQALEEHMLSVYREPNSNFYAAMGPYTRHGVTTGSPVIIPELDPDSGKILCIVPHPATRYFMQNKFGVTDTLHLKHEWTVRNAVKTFGYDNMSRAVQHSYDSGDDQRKIIIIRGIYFQLDRIFKDLPDDSGIDGTKIVIDGTEDRKPLKTFRPRWPWTSIYIERDNTGNENNPDGPKKPLKIEGYWTKPFSVWHYEKDQTEEYSRTPAWSSYHDVKVLNQQAKSNLMASQRQVDSAWWVPNYLRGKFKSYPRGINWYSVAQAPHKPEQLGERINYAPSVEVNAQYVKSCERWFFTRMWFMINRIAEDQGSPPTATQILQMGGEKAVIIGPRVGQFLGTMDEVDARFLDIEDRRGNLPIAPDIIQEHFQGQKARVNPEFIGPLAQLQKRFLSTQRVETALASIGPILEVYPMAKHKIKGEELVEFLLEEHKFPQDLIRSEEEFDEYVSAIVEEQIRQQGIEQGVEVAKAIPSVTKDIEPNSPVAGLLEAAQG